MYLPPSQQQQSSSSLIQMMNNQMPNMSGAQIMNGYQQRMTPRTMTTTTLPASTPSTPKEAFDNFNNVDPQAKTAFDHATTIIENSNQDKTFSVFSIPPREALAYYLGIEEHYQKEQIKPTCPLCMRQVHFSALSKHVVSCAEYRNSLISMEEAPPIKLPPSSITSITSPFQINGLPPSYTNPFIDGPLLGKRKKLDDLQPTVGPPSANVGFHDASLNYLSI